MQNNLLKKFLSFSLGSWISLLIGLISAPVITRLFSPKEFGKFSMFTLALNISMIFIMFGTDQTFVRFFYEEKEENRKFLLKNSLKIPFFIYSFVVLFAILFKDRISFELFNEKNEKAVYLLIIGIFLMLLQRYSVLVLRMKQKGGLYSILQVILKLSNFLFLIFFAFFVGRTFNELIYANVLSLFVVGMLALYFGREIWNFFKSRKIDLKHSLKDIFLYSYPLLLTSVITWLFQSFDRVAIKHWNTLSELGIYAAAFKIISILSIIQSTFTTFWVPVAYEHYEKDGENKDFFKRMNVIVSFVMLSVAIGVIVFKDILILLLGKDFSNASYIVPFLIFIPVMYTISETTVIGINFKKKVKFHILIAVISSALNIFGNYLLVPKYGGRGAAVSTGLSYIVFFMLRTHLSERYYKVGYDYLKIYFMLFLIASFALENTFYDMGFGFNFMQGTILLFLLFMLNIKYVKYYYSFVREKLKR